MPYYYYDKLRQAVPITEILPFYTGMPLDPRTGKAHCPAQNHADAHPSVQINLGGRYPNTCYCHTCNRPFDVLSVIKETCDLGTDAAAAERLITDFGLDRNLYCKTKEAMSERPLLTAEESKVIGVYYTKQDAEECPLTDISLYAMIINHAVFAYEDLQTRILGENEYLTKTFFGERQDPFTEEDLADSFVYQNLLAYEKRMDEIEKRKEGPLKEAYEELREREKLAYDSAEEARAYREGANYKKRPFRCSVTFDEYASRNHGVPYPVLYDATGRAFTHELVVPAGEGNREEMDAYYSLFSQAGVLSDVKKYREEYRERADIAFSVIERVLPMYQAQVKEGQAQYDAFLASDRAKAMSVEERASMRDEFLVDAPIPAAIEERLRKEGRIVLRLPVKKVVAEKPKAKLRLVRADGSQIPRKEEMDRC